MKRIKLFEAFTNTNKIENINHLLFCWSVREFINHTNLTPLLIDRTFGAREKFCLFGTHIILGDDYHFWFYPDEGDDVNIGCYSSLSDFLIDKKIYKQFFPGHRRLKTESLQKAVNHVVKKMYEDEKNKAV